MTSSVVAGPSKEGVTHWTADGLSSFGYDQVVKLDVPMAPDGPQGPFYYVGYLSISIATSIDATPPEDGPVQWDVEASADPTFQIDPAYPYANYFSLVVSSNLYVPNGWTPITPPRLTNAHFSGTNFSFSFQSVSNLTYAVEYTDDLRSTNWYFYDRVLGSGSLLSYLAPMTNHAPRFFRLRQP